MGCEYHIALVWAGTNPLTDILETRWTTMLQDCLNVIGTYWQCNRHAALFTVLCRHRFVPSLFYYGWPTVREE